MISESMISNLFRKAALKLAESGSIEEKYVELYVIAMQSLMAMLLNVATTLVIGYLLGMWWHSVILFAAFIPLRSYAGGYHARGYISCYLESCVILTAILLITRTIIQSPKPMPGLWILFLIAAAVVFLLAPLADENKPISEKEAIVFKRRARLILIVEIIVSVVFGAMNVDYCYAVMMAVILSALLLLLYKCREIVISRKEKLNM
ncbi:MAG: accessory gene regulator B family protein [Lachnospiraceae bacterium]|nr:accessory gene regulator B family protein [Lachnospiraceae bacterium]